MITPLPLGKSSSGFKVVSVHEPLLTLPAPAI